jgi:UDP-N-acetylmuramate dehydrogenase
MDALDRIRRLVDVCRREYPGAAEVRYAESMAAHTTFRAGGPADCWVRAGGADFPAFAAALLGAARAAGVPVFVLGGGANIVAADRGIRGIVLDTSGWKGLRGPPDWETASGPGLTFRAGTTMDEAAETAAAAGLSGLEFLAGMPGSIGGAVWMNARCYGREIADVLAETEIIDYSVPGPCRRTVQTIAGEFGYKRSPFQGREWLILSARFVPLPGNESEIRRKMEEYRRDRRDKGQYRFPCAGSVFKNNPAFGKPAGQIIDELGLRGLRSGGAQVAPFHGNIIINTGGASASDIRALADDIAGRVQAARGFVLEPEILFAGDW